MNKQIISILLFFQLTTLSFLVAQNESNISETKKESNLFKDQSILPIKLSYSNKELKKETNDSTYIKSFLSYKQDDGTWKTLDVELRARGKFRRSNCYFVPVKIKIKKENYKKTLFKGNKKLKLVLPCNTGIDNNDNILKEYLAYKLYEVISQYNFKTRLVDISLSESRGKKIKEHNIKGFLIEDDKIVAKRHEGKIIDRSINPLNQDPTTCVQNAYFQFMIGNVDFSIAKQHNAKLLYIDKKIFPLPYDFDMSGLVNPNYGNPGLGMKSMTQRKFRGVKRSTILMQRVRQEFISSKDEMLKIVNDLKSSFENQKEFDMAKNYINEFFDILINDKYFNQEILSAMRE